MDCVDCKHPHEKQSKFPQKVIQIDNERIVVFHTVEVPVDLGDETTFPPENGIYHNTLLHYLVNKHTYLYNSDGIPTQLSWGQTGGVTAFDELIGRPKYGNEIMSHETEIPDVSEVDNRLQGNIDAEAAARAEADTELDTNKQDKLTAGENITIDENNVISATGGGVSDYEALENKPQINTVELTGDKSAEDLGLQDKLTAGANITIENNVISATTEAGSDWSQVANKPFSTVGSGLTVEDDELEVDPSIIPTKTSDLTNDSDFVSDANYIHTDNNYTTEEKNKLAGLSNYDDTEVKQDITEIQQELPQKQEKIVSASATLTVAGWSDNQQTVTVTGVTADNNLIVAAAPDCIVEFSDAGVYASAQGANEITFTCVETPTSELTANVLIIN